MFGELQDALTEKLVKNTPKDLSWELGTVDIYQSEEDKDHKNLTFRLWISSFDKTLKAEEVNRLLDDLAEAAHEKFGAERL